MVDAVLGLVRSGDDDAWVPHWMLELPGCYYPPSSAQDYADFYAFAAQRWGYALAALELWNEPNGNFLYACNKAAAYARLVRAAYPAVKAAAHNLPVIMAFEPPASLVGVPLAVVTGTMYPALRRSPSPSDLAGSWPIATRC